MQQQIPLKTAPDSESENELFEKGLKIKFNNRTKKQSLISKLADYALALFFLLFLIGMILVCVFFGPGAPPSDLKTLTLDDLFDPALKEKVPTVTWLNDGKSYTTFSATNNILKYTIPGNNFVVLADQSKALDKSNKQLNFSNGYSFSYDEKYILIPVNLIMRYRYSFYANYLIWEIASQTFKPLVQLQDPPIILNAQWSTTDYTIAFVMNNDIYTTTAGNPDKYTQITNDGISNIENGMMAWVYEEEIFSDYNAIWWRPSTGSSQSQFLYFRFDNSQVPTFSYPIYNQDLDNDPYNTIIDLKYPKAGGINPKVSMVLYDINTNSSFTIPSLNDEYITDVTWVSSNLLVCRTTNRLQNVENMFMYSVNDKGVATLTNNFVTQSVENGWIEPRPYTLAFLSSNSFVFISNNSDNYHLIRVDLVNNQIRFNPLTSGSWDVTDLVGCNTAQSIVFFMAALPDPTERQLYAINAKVVGQPVNLTTNGYYSVHFSDSATNYILYYEGPDVPNSQVYQAPTTIQPVTVPIFVRNLETNQALKDKLREYNIPIRIFLPVEISNGLKLNTWYLLPPTLSTSFYYPLLLDIYCGPNSQTVTKKWKLGFDEYVTSLNIIVASVDCRGTGARGISFMQQVYTRLGSLEADDIIEVAKKIGDLYWMDTGRIGITGRSYGGYMTLTTLIKDTGNVFKTGISVAPVTDWRLYDTFYTERFMKTPKMNGPGYNQTSILTNADRLGKVPFLLVHGTGDDNVHFQNTALLNDKLVSQGIQYETMFYANRQHAINSQGSLKHLYTLMSNFLVKSLSGLSQVRLRPIDN